MASSVQTSMSTPPFIMKKQYVLLDDEGNPVRYFDYPHEGAVEVKEEKFVLDWNNFEECLL